ncbi:2-hydroxychromene-2-carboxylate isomerase [Niveispirillum sp. KHB5.9]|uniref:2-hydroxychromene-2-carboxylate isomerase n=1 Tax=Niveispirillum sp. KHB5.9 TaxID=3400269 RepID=UPI003A88A2D2
MMGAKKVEFLFDYGSPASYLAYKLLPAIAERHGAEIVWTPILLGGLFKIVGNRPPAEVPAKGRWMLQDLIRHAAYYQVPFAFNRFFPVNTLMLMRGAVVAQREGRLLPYSDAVFKALWVDGRNMNDPDIVAKVWAGAGFDPAALFAAANEGGAKDGLRHLTEAAAERGVFGAPTFFVGDAMFFGQDRLDFVDRELAVA